MTNFKTTTVFAAAAAVAGFSVFGANLGRDDLLNRQQHPLADIDTTPLDYTDCFESKYTEVEGDEDVVLSLPGYNDHLLSRTYSGFVDVNEKYDSKLFYMFYEKIQGADTPSDEHTPILFWLNGGPGASSSLGNFMENGPYKIQPNGKLEFNKFTWNKQAHIAYWDQPVGTGYSHFDLEKYGNDGYVENYEELAKDFVRGTFAFFEKHPKFRKNPFYVTGESFGGVYIPFIVKALYDAHSQLDYDDGSKFNLKGALIGNPGVFSYRQYHSQIEFFLTHGLIDDNQAHIAQKMFDTCDLLTKEGKPGEGFDMCEKMSNYLLKCAGNPFIYDITKWKDLFTEEYSPALARYLDQNPQVKHALNVPKGLKWNNGDGTAAPNPVVNKLHDKLMGDMGPTIKYILSKGLRFGTFVGVNDGSACNIIGVYNEIRRLNHKGFNDAKRHLWTSETSKSNSDGSNTGGEMDKYGYYSYANGLTFVWVANSGHLVPTDQPKASYSLLSDFLDHSFES